MLLDRVSQIILSAALWSAGSYQPDDGRKVSSSLDCMGITFWAKLTFLPDFFASRWFKGNVLPSLVEEVLV